MTEISTFLPYRILFVDDNIQFLNGIKRYFRKRFSFDMAFSGVDGLRLLTEKRYAIIVSDYRMPHINGIEFLSKAKLLAPDNIRILFTGHADLDIAISAVNEGEIFKFVSKPCDLEILTGILINGIEKYKMHVRGKLEQPEKLDELNIPSLLTREEITMLLSNAPDKG